MSFWRWSRTAAADATADPSINWAEGMAPSAINDSARGMMAALAKYRDDVGGNLVTGGSSTAYTVASNQVFADLPSMDFKEVTFFVHATNGVNPTLNVDGLGAKPISMDGLGTPVPSGTLIQGTPYTAVYVNATSNWRLKDFYQLPYMVPVGGMVDYFGATAPNSSFVLPFGQAISRTTYSGLFALIGTNFGVGDGASTFNIPDLRGRVVAGSDVMGGAAAGRLTTATMSFSGIGAVGGTETQTLTLGQIPANITSIGNFTVSPNFILSNPNGGLTQFSSGTGGSQVWQAWSTGANIVNTGSPSASGTVTSNNTSGGSHPNVQPTMSANKLIRII
ncbi:phage tail protein [Bradyrhizobium pachyrhizi]|uniref:phage tail protein n=1 Tax=Bradyrhizobium pachyrhizi TaxID=280333 RepID=UPI003D36651F